MTEEEMQISSATRSLLRLLQDLLRRWWSREGGRAPAAPRDPRARRDGTSSTPVELTLEEAYHGATRRISIKQGGHARSVDVRIPVGVKDGSRVRAAGEGEAGANGGSAGDLYLRVQISRTPSSNARATTSTDQWPLPVTTTVLGGEAQVPTIAGAGRSRFPKRTQTGQVFRLKGHGMPHCRQAGHRGNLYATVNVQLPRSLTKEQREHYEALAKLEK